MVYSLGLARAIFITSAYMRYSVEAAPCAPQAAGCSLLQAGRCAINGVEACGRSKPLCVVTRLQYHPLPIMDIRHDLIRFARDDGNGRNIISRLVLPHAPDARQCKGFSSRNGYLIFGIVLLMQRFHSKKLSAGTIQRRSSKEVFQRPDLRMPSDLVLKVKRWGKVKPQYISPMLRSPSSFVNTTG